MIIFATPFRKIRCGSSVWLEYRPVTPGVAGSSPVRTAGKNIENQCFKKPRKSSGFFFMHLSYIFDIVRTRGPFALLWDQRIIRDTCTAIALHFLAVENIASLATKNTPHSHRSILGQLIINDLQKQDWLWVLSEVPKNRSNFNKILIISILQKS